MSKLIIYGSTPSKKNSKIMVCRGKFPMLLPSSRYTEWHKDALKQLTGHKGITSSRLQLTFFAPDNRKFDLTNKAESIMDTLVDAGLISDDNYSVISELTLKFGGVDKGNARCEIEYE
jgi:Holliday junction resolvase RusA-like endonuclease